MFTIVLWSVANWDTFSDILRGGLVYDSAGDREVSDAEGDCAVDKDDPDAENDSAMSYGVFIRIRTQIQF